MNNLILISDSDDVKQKMQGNLVLLRRADKIRFVTYENAPDMLYNMNSDVIILHENELRQKTINLIKYIRCKKNFSNTNIILLLNKFDQNFILSAYDEGVEDYFMLESEPSEMLIRTINCMKKSGLKRKIKNLEFYLEYYGIKDSKSGFYSAKFAEEVFENEIINNKYSDICFMIISPDDNGKKEFSAEDMNSAIKKSVRVEDLVAGPCGSKYYFMLHSDVEGAINVFERIKKFLPPQLTIKAGITMVNDKKYLDVEKNAVCSLNNSLLTNKDYTIYSENTVNVEDWLDIPQSEEKVYKFFKNAFGKKLEKVISPVFYRYQKTYEEKLPGAKIEQFTDEQQSIFRILYSGNESRLTIIYPGYSKIMIYVTHSGLNTPENHEICLPLNSVNQKDISNVVEDFINEFSCTYKI